MAEAKISVETTDQKSFVASLEAQWTVESLPGIDAQAFGEEWIRENQALLNRLPMGTVVIVCVGSGAYITAGSSLAALELFAERFGKHARGWSFEVGVPITLGGGLWQLRSDTSTIGGEP